MADGVHTRSYDWHDPARLGAFAREVDGLEFITSMFSGKVPPPPIISTLAFDGGTAEKGTVTFSFEPQEIHYNPLGSVHGGVFSTVLDSALGCAVHTTLSKGQGFTSLTLEVKFLRPAFGNTGTLTCTGKVVTRGKQIATAEADIRDARGRIYATATSTLMIFAAPEAEPVSVTAA